MTENVQSDWRERRIADLEAQLQQAKAENATLKEEMGRLQQRIAELERAGKRQATPFARREHNPDPKRPGRKAGQGRFSYRARPTPESVDQTKEARLDGCLECGGPLTDVQEHEQFVVDIPEVQPTVTRYVTQSGYCGQCCRRVRSRHPEQISAATGRRASRLDRERKPWGRTSNTGWGYRMLKSAS
jgi:hypothetical protein